ncbi:MAG: trigger factor [Actinobacteria bacterium 69-20]|nr:trigger factor [Actinomycetota bacterium]OJV23142.1 MAG: trigger factor [Actinobacteria bacterium 69-20]
MKSTVEHLNPTRVKLTVEVGFDELKPHFDKAYKALAGQVKIPGFRPGKVPAKILEARLGRGSILTEVVNDAVPAKYGEAVGKEELSVLGQPDIEISKIEDGEVLEFTAEVDVRPEITLPELSSISVTVDDLEVTESDIDEQVEALRDRFATTVTVDRPAADGDQVTVNLRASIGGEPLADATADGLTYRVGSGELIDGIDEAVTGLSAGDSASFTSPLVAGEHAGEDADIEVSVTAVAERTLPEIDDDFAQLASEFDTVAALRDDLKEKITRVKNLQRAGDARDKVLSHLLEVTEIPVPEGARKAEIEGRQHEAVHSFGHDEDALAAHLESIGQTREELDAEIETSADEAVRTQLLLDALADATAATVTQQEFSERVMYNAQRFGMRPDEYFQQLQQAGQLGGVFAEVRRGKALMSVVQQATITSLSGETLDFATLFGIEAVDEPVDEPVEEPSDDSVDVESTAAGDTAAEADAAPEGESPQSALTAD